MSAAASVWPRVWALYGCGLLAAAQLGRLSALAPLIAADLQLALPTVALAISLLEIGGATAGAVAGLLGQRLGLRRCLGWGLAALAAGGLGGAWAQGAASLLGWRLLEAMGYLGVIVSAPVLIARLAAGPAELANGRRQGLALALWSTFVPVGLALGAWASAGLAAADGAGLGWRGASLANGGLALLCLALAQWALPAHGLAARPSDLADARAAAPGLPAAAWCLCLAFGGFALFQVGLLGLLPSLLVQQAGVPAAEAGRWTALASLAAVPGSALAALLLRRQGRLQVPMLWSLGLPALLLFGVFTAAPPVGQAVGLAMGINLLGGVFAGLAFAQLPVVAGRADRMVRVNGLLAQCGASGSLLGPPLMAACVQAGGWPAAAGLGMAVTVLALPLAWRAAAWAALAAETARRQAGAVPD